jgi:alkylation response protein AidB-like acyl-CoA dehydrogenase
MDLLTASVEVAVEDGDGVELAVALIPAGDDGVERRPFWRSNILAGAESDEVIVRDVAIPKDLLVRTGSSSADDLGKVQLRGFLWFELLMTASYLGVASALAERVITDDRGTAGERAALGIELEATMTALEGLARAMGDGGEDSEVFAKALWVRYAAQDAIRRVTGSAVELLGGMAFIASPEVAYLSSAAQALAFHPPARGRMHDHLADLLREGSLAVA